MNAPVELLRTIPHDWDAFAYARRLRLEADFELLKARMLMRALDETPIMELHLHIFRAASEATALAQQTPFPFLVFPGLFEEKVRAVLDRAGRRAAIVTQL